MKKPYLLAFAFLGLYLTGCNKEEPAILTNIKIVYKNGAESGFSVVFDDGTKSTSDFIKTRLNDYPDLKASFAVPINKFATLNTSSTEYIVDEDGNFSWTINSTQRNTIDYWNNLLETSDGRFEVLNHSYSHSYFGENDDGGTQMAQPTDGGPKEAKNVLKNSVSAQIVGSYQIMQSVLENNTGHCMVNPGVSYERSDYYYQRMEDSGLYVGARSTHTVPEDPADMVNHPETFKESATRFQAKSYMVQHYKTNPNAIISKASNVAEATQCTNEDITYWTDYVDQGITDKGWSCFCFHKVIEDNTVGSGHWTYQKQVNKLFQHAQNKCDSAKLYWGTFEELSIYNTLMGTMDLAASRKGDTISVTLQNNETNTLFKRVPIMLKVEVPSNWTSLTYGGTKTASCYKEGNKNYGNISCSSSVRNLTLQKN